MDIATAWHELSMLLESTRCAATVTEVKRADYEKLLCRAVVTRYPSDNEFPAYDEKICVVEDSAWSPIVEKLRNMLEAGDIPSD